MLLNTGINDPEASLYSGLHGAMDQAEHEFHICWLLTHIKDVTVWGGNHKTDKRSFQGSTRYIFSNVKSSTLLQVYELSLSVYLVSCHKIVMKNG